MKKFSIIFAGFVLLLVFVSIMCLLPQIDLSCAQDTDDADQLSTQQASNMIHSQGFPASGPSFLPKPIIVEPQTESFQERLKRSISLDVREMNAIDVLKFLALKGEFNLVTSSQVAGRVTLFLKNVTIGDAIEIVLISNKLGYQLENDIVHVMTEVEYEAMYGKKYNDKNEVKIIQLKYAKPSYALATLDSLKSALGKVVIDEDTGSVVLIDNPESLDRMLKALEKMETPLQSFVYTLQFAKADVVAEKLRARLESHTVGTVAVDERSNKLVVRALPERRKEFEKIIRLLDTPTKEVLVEVRVLQVNFRPQFDVGIDWKLDFRDSKYNILRRMDFSNIFIDEDNLAASTNLYSKYSRMGIGDFDVNKFEGAIRALKQVSNTKILSNPKLLVTNNQEAVIHVGDTIPYIITTVSGTGDNAITSEDVRFVDVGLKLNVTPSINDDGFVTMHLKPEISTVSATVDSQGGGIPQVNKTLVETTVMVKDGTTIVLGGLKKDNKVMTQKGIPILMDIPFVKRLFSAVSESIETTEIVIFITPHIVTGEEDFQEYKGGIKTDLSRDPKGLKGQQTLTIKE